MSSNATNLAPVSGRARIEVLDVLRGLAILGIFFMNVPFMGQSPWRFFGDVRSIGWSPTDQTVWYSIQILLEGTQRGLLELLFGAGLMVLAAKAMQPDGPVAVADLYIRRNLWLLGFGLLNIFVLLWPGDILHVYALAALFLFPFRTLAPRWLLTIGLAFAAFTVVGGSFQYAERVTLAREAQTVQTRVAAGQPLSAEQGKTADEWRKVVERREMREFKRPWLEREAKAYRGGLAAYAPYLWAVWVWMAGDWLLLGIAEAFCVMLIGMALWKWGVIQGERSRRFYLLLMLGGYGFGLTARAVGAVEIASPGPEPNTIWITAECARIATSVGHLALINLLMKTEAGQAVLRPFQAAGRTAFSLYLLQSVIGLWLLFAPFGLGLWGTMSWAGLAAVAVAVVAVQLVLANFWMRRFACGPVEWLWRSLSYVRLLPFRKQSSEPRPAGEVAPMPA